MDDGVLLLTISVFIVSSPKDVICVPNLIKPCAEIFKKAWDSDDIMVIIFSLFNHTKLLMLFRDVNFGFGGARPFNWVASYRNLLKNLIRNQSNVVEKVHNCMQKKTTGVLLLAIVYI